MKAATGKIEQGEQTRARLVEVARTLFAERGYAGTSAEEIVRRAGVTRGALYHHFDGKKNLFEQVFEEVEAEVIAEIAERMADAQDATDVLHTGTLAFLDVCTDPEISRIGMVDAPSALGWQKWREIDIRYSLGLVMAALEAGMEDGTFPRQPVLPLAHLLLGAMIEAGMMIANSEDPAATRVEVEGPLISLLEGLKARPSG